jgi:gamma-glutamylcyclotransferase (GGCT)/AIG2-like uncharacterized protein YtfP
MKIAVYGTLRKGEVNHALMNHVGAKYVETRTVDGLEILVSKSLGFPVAIIKAGSRAVVEIYEVAESNLSALDRLESYRPSDMDGSMYHRVALPDDSKTSVYVGNPKFWRGRETRFKPVTDWITFSRRGN